MKERLDCYLVRELGVESREKSKAYIMAGIVYINEQKASKAGEMVKLQDKVEIRGKTNPYVSRGGLKLAKGIQEFNIFLQDKICMDIGASTGGFTDCMLQNGATKVYAIDVGYGQLAWKLREDSRVINLERTNIRYITEEEIGEKIEFISIDVSFISLKLVLPVAFTHLSDSGEVLCLIKPQFEVGKENVGKKGVVRCPKLQQEVIELIYDFSKSLGFFVENLTFSPVKGPEGNIEFLLYLKKKEGKEFYKEEIVSQVNLAHATFEKG